MNGFCRFFCLILLSAEAASSNVSVLRKTRALADDTHVVSLAFCESRLPAEDKMPKKTLEEVHTYAELKNDPRASLPDSFTVCSTIMTTGCQSWRSPMFFNILGSNNSQLLTPYVSHGLMKSKFIIGFEKEELPLLIGKLPPLFPNQWTRSCLVVNTTSGLIHWVVDGTLVVIPDICPFFTPADFKA